MTMKKAMKTMINTINKDLKFKNGCIIIEAVKEEELTYDFLDDEILFINDEFVDKNKLKNKKYIDQLIDTLLDDPGNPKFKDNLLKLIE